MVHEKGRPVLQHHSTKSLVHGHHVARTGLRGYGLHYDSGERMDQIDGSSYPLSFAGRTLAARPSLNGMQMQRGIEDRRPGLLQERMSYESSAQMSTATWTLMKLGSRENALPMSWQIGPPLERGKSHSPTTPEASGSQRLQMWQRHWVIWPQEIQGLRT